MSAPIQEEFPERDFDDVLEANRLYATEFVDGGLTGRAARGLAIITCMDSRIDPLAIVGMGAGDVKILRNAGARVTEDVLRTLVLATHLLGVDRVLVMPHTDCRMAKAEESVIHEAIFEASGVDSRSLEMRVSPDQVGALRADITRIRSYPYLPRDLAVGGAIYDVHTGILSTVSA